MERKDNEGNELTVGDTVIFFLKGWRNTDSCLKRGIIKHFSKFGATIEYIAREGVIGKNNVSFNKIIKT